MQKSFDLLRSKLFVISSYFQNRVFSFTTVFSLFFNYFAMFNIFSVFDSENNVKLIFPFIYSENLKFFYTNFTQHAVNYFQTIDFQLVDKARAKNLNRSFSILCDTSTSSVHRFAALREIKNNGLLLHLLFKKE